MTPHSEHPETTAIRTQVPASPEREHSVPLFLTSSFVFESAEQARALFAEEIPGNIYSRYSNPNADEFVRKICQLEGADDGVATASGMAAVFATLAALLKAGDHIVAGRALFGSTHQILTRLLPRWGIEHSYAELTDRESWKGVFRPNTRLVFVETPSNPGLDLVDLRWLAELAHTNRTPLVVDNCFTTPYLQQPINHGADLVIHSATKYLDGQGRTLGGVVVGPQGLIGEIRFFARHTGPALSPFNAWILSKSLETLAVRMDRHCSNALTLASHFEGHTELERVRYPFLPSHPQYDLARRQMCQGGGIVVLVLRGGLERARRFLDAVRLLSHSPNLGDTRSIVTHPTSTTHSKLTEEERLRVGIVPGLIRISVGLEHVDDVVADVEQALAASR
ncbi:MAG TPA: aminotransferase class I/II-fold pyridoxal phosphate-dependent enzyme [Gemmatimonadales bacterium]|nr:aminotransferase class I/II-fold pyridoxal phosphate-dependent enzyme [Gemmatimonadales bacterium]